MSKKDKVIAIACADIHLSLKAPIWRSPEPDWLKAQARVLRQVQDIQNQQDDDCPILCAGDVFDYWDSKAELINWTYKNSPMMCAIAGQHDLPRHRYKDIHKSAFLSLITNDILYSLFDTKYTISSEFEIFPFKYGQKITPCSTAKLYRLKIAIAHEYVWMDNHNYTTAAKDLHLHNKKAKVINNKWNGYDVVIYGDNHKGFITRIGDTQIINCGSLIRRKSDQVDYKPFVTLIYKSGKVEPHYLDISKDKYLSTSEISERGNYIEDEMSLDEFFEELEKLDTHDWDILAATKKYFHKKKVKASVREMIFGIMERAKYE